MSTEFAEAVGLHPISFLTLVYAAQSGQSPLEILRLAESELNAAALLDAEVGSAPEEVVDRKKARAALTACAVLKLKNEGKTQAEAARELKISTSTVGRHWRSDPQGRGTE
jgi:DNA-binding NarL/FixJ family response regulator